MTDKTEVVLTGDHSAQMSYRIEDESMFTSRPGWFIAKYPESPSLWLNVNLGSESVSPIKGVKFMVNGWVADEMNENDLKEFLVIKK